MNKTDFDGKNPALDGSFSRIMPRPNASDHLLTTLTIAEKSGKTEKTEGASHETMHTLHAIMASLAPTVFVKDAHESEKIADRPALAGVESADGAADQHLFI